jgi:predicted GTPase
VASDAATIDLCIISHTNAGKTTLARTLLGREIGEVRDQPHVTEIAESHVLLETPQGDVLRLWDTPGFGDSVRLVKRLMLSDNPIGWMLREVWDRFRDRPFWCSQQAMRAARESTDVVLYLANAAEDPRDATYVTAEMQILRWIDKPVLLLLNQVGPPKPAAQEHAEEERWRSHVAPLAVVREVLTLDAFARCWVQEGVLLRAVAKVLPEEQREPFARLSAAWTARNVVRFDAAMAILAEQIARTARDREPLAPAAPRGVAQQVLKSFGIGKRSRDATRDRAIDALAERLDRETRDATQRLIGLHGLEGNATAMVLQRVREHLADTGRIGEGRAAALGGIVSGALSGLAADLAAGGLTLGAGMLAGGILGALGGVGIARSYNIIRGRDQAAIGWGAPSLDALAAAAIVRYLAVAHFGRGRGRYVEGEAPAFWRNEATRAIADHSATLHALWENAAPSEDPEQVQHDLQNTLASATAEVFERLYPGRVSAALAESRAE